MARVKSTDSRAELRVRRAIHASGLRYRLHDPRLPGKPDLVFKRLRTVVFVHGCFWHRHEGCPHASTPSSNVDYWAAKFGRNVIRDERTQESLSRDGWSVIVLWECEVPGPVLNDVIAHLREKRQQLPAL